LVSLGELLELPTLQGARLQGDRAAASREVGWLATVRIRPARPQQLRSGEMLLVPPESTASAAQRGGLAAVLRQLLALEPAALAVWDPVPPEALAVLRESGLPYLLVPQTASAAAIEREATRHIADHQAELQRLETTAYRELLELVIHGRGVAALVAALARLTEKAVALEDADQQLLRLEWPAAAGCYSAAAAAPSGPIAAAPAIAPPNSRELLNGANAAGVRHWLTDLPASATDPPTALFDLENRGWARLVAPVHGATGLAGVLSLIAPRARFAPRDRLLLKRATAACALEFAKQSAVLDAQELPRGEFVAGLLAGDLPEPQLVEHRATRLGYRLGSAHNVLVLRAAGEQQSVAEASVDAQADRRFEELLAWRLGADGTALPQRVQHGIAALILPVDRFGDARTLASWAATLHRQLNGDRSVGPLSAGLGQPQNGLGGIRLAYQGALWALDLGVRLFGPGRFTRLQDLGVYRLLLTLQERPELSDFHQELLAPLVDYDQQRRAELLGTLQAYFDAGNSPSETAGRLHLHRNTVLYRLRRIRELLGRDPDDPQQRLALQLALCARVVLAGTS
jgi:purine catabolism regulator